MSVNQLRRNVRNVVHNYSEAQVKVREATSNDPWGPSSTIMSQIAELTHNVVAFADVMQMIFRRLNDHGKNWRHVSKALTLLDYLVKVGSNNVAEYCQQNLFTIETLKDFQHFDDNVDHGRAIRERSVYLVSLLKDEHRLAEERKRAVKSYERFLESTGMTGVSRRRDNLSPLSHQERGVDVGDSSLSSPPKLPSSSSASASAIDTAWPQTAGEEELQLQLAIAMSQEEAERDKQREKKDELRLQMAIKESAAVSTISHTQTKKTSALEDLMSLNQPVAPAAQTGASAMDPWVPSGSQTVDPWGQTPVASTEVDKVHNNNHNNSGSNNLDPWQSQSGGFQVNTVPPAQTADPWQPNNQQGGSGSVVDPWSPPAASADDAVSGSAALPCVDPWTPHTQSNASANQQGGEEEEFAKLTRRDSITVAPSTGGPGMSSPWDMQQLNNTLTPTPVNGHSTSPKQQQQSHREMSRSPHDFLGENVNLVNLDNLVGPPNPPGPSKSSATANPFGLTITHSGSGANPNPFLINQPVPPSINEIRSRKFDSVGDQIPDRDQSNPLNPFAS